MIRAAIAVLLLAAAFAGPVSAGEKKAAPILTQEARDGAQLTQENIIKMKIRTVRPVQLNQPAPPIGRPSVPPQSPGSLLNQRLSL
jgi:hypothetical protein